jgi:hypothetical protein
MTKSKRRLWALIVLIPLAGVVFVCTGCAIEVARPILLQRQLDTILTDKGEAELLEWCQRNGIEPQKTNGVYKIYIHGHTIFEYTEEYTIYVSEGRIRRHEKKSTVTGI